MSAGAYFMAWCWDGGRCRTSLLVAAPRSPAPEEVASSGDGRERGRQRHQPVRRHDRPRRGNSAAGEEERVTVPVWRTCDKWILFSQKFFK